jgi:AcrR family transcriptional regulator
MEQRRGRIVAAAREELLSARRFSLEAVAERAGVSRVTLYAQFGDRDALLEAVYDDLAASGGLQRIPEAFATEDLGTALEMVVGIFCHFYGVHRDVLRRLQALSVLSATEPSTHVARNARRRNLIQALLARAGIDDGHRVDALQALTSFAYVDELAGPDRAPEDVAAEIATLVTLVAAGRG